MNQLNGNSFGSLNGFGMFSSSGTVFYYLMDYGASKAYILNDNWSFISLKTFPYPFYMISIDNSLYMTGRDNVWKLDQDLNILIQYNSRINPHYRGISYNPSNGSIYVLSYWLYHMIQVFNLDLTLIRSFSTSPHAPWSITVSSNQLYVRTGEDIILVYQREILINQFDGCNRNNALLTFILFDPNGYIATTCNPTNKLYIFSPDGSFTGKSITIPEYPYYIGFDSKGGLIQISNKPISIYN